MSAGLHSERGSCVLDQMTGQDLHTNLNVLHTVYNVHTQAQTVPGGSSFKWSRLRKQEFMESVGDMKRRRDTD